MPINAELIMRGRNILKQPPPPAGRRSTQRWDKILQPEGLRGNRYRGLQHRQASLQLPGIAHHLLDRTDRSQHRGLRSSSSTTLSH
jgi:hypothetical protein